eukprot:11208234-Lingulodinium_polyedra.AAC.1
MGLLRSAGAVQCGPAPSSSRVGTFLPSSLSESAQAKYEAALARFARSCEEQAVDFDSLTE